MCYQVLSTGSEGNAVIYHGFIMVDCGVPFSIVKPVIQDIQVVLLTHTHGDHFKLSTIKKLAYERPTIRFACGEWMVKHLNDIRNIDVLLPGKIYNYGLFRLSPVVLYHDVPNYGYRIYYKNHKIFHATDSAHLEGITALEYDLYAIEHNYDEETVFENIAKLKAKGQFAHQEGSINSHLSEQQAQDFILRNKGDNYQVLRLHESKHI
ncbi:MBL fold metallo-hydrolase [Carboxylicivirga sediminis]|uniref:MBL fold metallo-hydrolase n=1 Tax=Carboxylicivirga sediminis TaxID=2006564 RepID=A0A941IXI6_9BACT|nr:MBL fold metallo-hydrolase [Carboxylicivirga sediminis]MBR8535439.1 MBL fold metallo-hydrolase [Carboxylicivirga sediminis]